MRGRIRSYLWSTLLVLSWIREAAVSGLSSSSSNPKRPIVSLTGEGEVSSFLYGKLQRATSLYGSGLCGPATAVFHGSKDVSQLLPREISTIASPQKQLKDLENMLWNQFGMATCEGSVEREDLLTPMSYLKPKLCELKDTLVFLDATTTGMGKKQSNGGGGLGGLFSSILPGKPGAKQPLRQQKTASVDTSTKNGWLDIDLVRSAVSRGSGIFVVCESQDTESCAKALADCMASLGEDVNDSIVTLIAPDDNVRLGDSSESRWNSLRPQDLEGELSKTVSVRDGTDEYLSQMEEVHEAEKPTFKRTREERLAAAYAEDVLPPQSSESVAKGSEARMAAAENFKPPVNLSMHDLAEVCVQCALRLPITSSSGNVRVVRVTPIDAEEGQESSSLGTERPNMDYFTLTGGPKAKAKAGTITSVDWPKVLSCFATDSSVKEFPKRPDVA
mmetsp:Transcript_20554/g.51109  ORF Transcript_20554/g.51109 Transcript_20554/m.51109 type:complete len:446 (-) Transcript_20554:138-1475(-)